MSGAAEELSDEASGGHYGSGDYGSGAAGFLNGLSNKSYPHQDDHDDDSAAWIYFAIVFFVVFMGVGTWAYYDPPRPWYAIRSVNAATQPVTEGVVVMDTPVMGTPKDSTVETQALLTDAPKKRFSLKIPVFGRTR